MSTPDLPASRLVMPLVSACVVVQDAEDQLPTCLASLEGLADEVVVYDTGSVDATPEAARKAGAVVIEGIWAEDPFAARNAALNACRGQWVLQVEATEAVVADASARQALRALLASKKARFDVLEVEVAGTVEQSGDEEAGLANGSPTPGGEDLGPRRLFRRQRARWTGRGNERLVARPSQAPLTVAGPASGCGRVVIDNGNAPALPR